MGIRQQSLVDERAITKFGPTAFVPARRTCCLPITRDFRQLRQTICTDELVSAGVCELLD
jgi:hypothetical protein